MRLGLTPARRRGIEILDDASTPSSLRDNAMADVARSNRLFGGTRAATRAIGRLVRDQASVTLLDVGTGLADIPARARAQAERFGTSVTTYGVDISEDLLRTARISLTAAICGDATRFPLGDDSV